MFDPIWVCADGRRMKISEMTDYHLNNAIAKIQRSRKGWRREYLDRLLLETELRSMQRRA